MNYISTLNFIKNFYEINNHGRISFCLNNIRWMSAFFVLIGHVRNTIFQSYNTLDNHGIVLSIFYAITNIQNEAVICFFVVSGLLVGGKLANYRIQRNIPLNRFAIDRLVRLYIVLIPAISLTFLISTTGACGGSAPKDWVGALFFLQHILVPVLPCNKPLWSLSNEFWYYLMATVFFISTANRKFIYILILVVLFVVSYDSFNSQSVILYIPIWAIGILTLFLKPLARIRFSFIMLFLAIALSRSHIIEKYYFINDLFIAITLGIFISSNFSGHDGHRVESISPKIDKVSALLANFSFSLYVTHWPIMMLLIKILFNGEQIAPLNPNDRWSYLYFFTIVFSCILFSYIFSIFTEANTIRIRQFLYKRLLCR